MLQDMPQTVELSRMVIKRDDRRKPERRRAEGRGIGEQQKEGKDNVAIHDAGSYRSDGETALV